MRGCTVVASGPGCVRVLFPAHAGMHRSARSSSRASGSVPRACGDAPLLARLAHNVRCCSPRMRGCTVGHGDVGHAPALFPAHAGMHRPRARCRRRRRSVPRACGDAPQVQFGGEAVVSCSPRMRGCTDAALGQFGAITLFPAHAEMHRPRLCDGCARMAVPRTCGDAPGAVPGYLWAAACSPRMRGCTEPGREVRGCRPLFPAHAGMQHSGRCRRCGSRPVPRACRDTPPVARRGAGAGLG